MKQARRIRILFLTLLAPLISVPFSFAGWEKDIPLAEVPEKVLQAAKAAVKGFEPLEAELERKLNGRVIYELEGVSSANGESYELEISKKGKVLKIEKGDDDFLEEEEDDDGE